MRRSLLFIPCNSPAMLQNSDVFGADTVIFDLEDSVSLTEKDAARNLLASYLTTKRQNELEIAVRINGMDTNLYTDDLHKILSDNIDTLVVPKAFSADLVELDGILTKMERARGMKKTIKLVPIIEQAAAVLQMSEIANCPRVDGLLLGAEDLSTDMEVVRTKKGEEILYPRMKMAYVCKTYKIDAIDTPFTATDDQEGLRQDCEFVMGLGFNAKAAIHPNQVPVINHQFIPTTKQIEFALRVEQAAIDAEKRGLGVFSLDGKMVDKPIIERAKRVLTKARKYNLL